MAQVAHGVFHWNELLTPDPERAVKFFEEVIGWTFDAMAMDGTDDKYWVGKINDQPVGGIMQIKGVAPDGTPPHWVSYLAVDGIDARVMAAERAGATIIREPFSVDGIGRIALLKDPTGGVMGWITPAQ